MTTATEGSSSTTSPSLADLRDELRAAGLGMHTRELRTYAKFVFFMTAALGGLYWVIANHEASLFERIPVGLLSGWFLTAGAMCGHDAAHGATSPHAWRNTLLAQLGFTLLGGLSVTYWRHKHNSLHHPQVNIARRDPDIEQSALSLSTRQYGEKARPVRFLQRHFQSFGFWFGGAPLVLVDLKITSIRFVIAALRSGNNRAAHLADLAWLVAHYLAWLVLPLAFIPAQTMFVVYALSTVVFGFFLTFIFAPAHMPYPVVKESHDPLLLQLASTRNFRVNWFFRVTLIGLDRQVEHHLAPMLSHFELPRASEIVRAYCTRHGLPYHETGWLRALWDTNTQVGKGWRIEEVVVGAPDEVEVRAAA